MLCYECMKIERGIKVTTWWPTDIYDPREKRSAFWQAIPGIPNRQHTGGPQTLLRTYPSKVQRYGTYTAKFPTADDAKSNLLHFWGERGKKTGEELLNFWRLAQKNEKQLQRLTYSGLVVVCLYFFAIISFRRRLGFTSQSSGVLI